MLKPTPKSVLLLCTLITRIRRVFFAVLKRSIVRATKTLALSLLAIALMGIYTYTRAYPPAHAATASTFNFQARLMTGVGSIVPDGYYNVQFKLYDGGTQGGPAGPGAANAGTNLWTETYYDSDGAGANPDNRVQVKAGYLTVNLGSQTAFPGTINWDQELWLTMNIGGTTHTATPTWDGEMLTPTNARIKLTAVPYAFKAAQAANVKSADTTTASTNSDAVSITSGNASGTTSNSGTITIDAGTATQTTGQLLFGTTNASALTLGRTGITTSIQGTTAITGTGTALTVTNSASIGNTLTVGGAAQAGLLVVNDGSGYTAALRTVALTDNRIIELPDESGVLCIQGSTNCGFITGSAADFIQNQNALQQTANYWISGTARADTSVLTPLLDTATATVLNIGTTNATGINLNQDTTLASGKTLRVVGDTYTNIDGYPSPTEGQITYDQTNDQLLIYTNGKWQADKSDAILVAASNSSQADKNAADYVADGEIGDGQTTLDGDQIEINQALTAGAGKKVVLLAGTYTADATILVPNNTTLAGVGAGTLIQLADIDVSDNLIQNANTAPGTGVVIQDLRLDGQSSLNTTGTQWGVYFNGVGDSASSLVGGRIENIEVSNFRNRGIHIYNSDNTKIVGNTLSANEYGLYLGLTYDSVINSNFSANNTNSGFYFADSARNEISANTSRSNAQYGFYFGGSTEFNKIVGNNAQSNGSSGFHLQGAGYNTVDGNVSEGNTLNGFMVTVNANYNNLSNNIVNNNLSSGFNISIADYNTISSNKIHSSGGSTQNNGIIVGGGSDSSDFNVIADNYIFDDSATTINNAINIDNSGADNNYLANNFFKSTAGNSIINNAGTGTIYANQSLAENGGKLTTRTAADVASFQIQNAAGLGLFTTDTTNSEVEIGSATLAGKLVVSDGSSNTATITVQPLAGNYTVAIPTITANDTFCLASLGNCANGTLYIQNQNASQQTANYWISGSARADTSVLTPLLDTATAVALNIGTTNATQINLNQNTQITGSLSFASGANRTINVMANGVNATGYDLTVKAGAAGAGASAFSGGDLILQGGDAAGTGNANGGDLLLSGGAGTGTGVKGLVVIDTPTFATSATQNCGVDCTITQANVDATAAVIINATAGGLTVGMPDPTNNTAGRVVYVTAANGSEDFTLSVNGGGQGNEIAMRANTTATMIWNGNDWTAAGASSSTTLQAAYDNTLSSAGGAEIVLNNTATSNGLTVRNSATSPIIGGIFEAQSAIGSNLFSVNNNATEYATNGGAETVGASASAFPANTWDATTGGTVDRYTTTGDNIATGAASVRMQATAINHGARNRLSAALTSGLTYSVSFAIRGAVNFSSLQVLYSPDGSTSGTTQCSTAETATSGMWTRISCTFIAGGSINSSNSILIRQTDATARTFYIDNLSVSINASATYASDGSVDDAGNFATNWTNYAASGTATMARDTATIYDTSASAEVTASATAGIGMRNNMSITPQINTQYLVSFYAYSSTTMTNSMAVGFLPAGGTSAPSGTAACTDYNTQTVPATTWTKITCLFSTTATAISDPDLVIYQTDASARVINIDALSITLNTNNANNVQIGGSNKGGPTTLFTLDRSDSAPIAANNEAYLGSMYYDTTTGRIQCYEADGWGACGSAPDNIVNLNPEYSGAVLNGTGVGTMTADLCANESGVLVVNTSLCSSGEAKNYYKWTSPQATQQTYSIYVSYQLPTTFKGFASDDTVQLTARVDNTTNASVTYEMFRSEGGAITQCGAGETAVTSSANVWQTVGINGNEATGCGFTSNSGGAFVMFKINVKANSNANAYVSTLTFTTTGK